MSRYGELVERGHALAGEGNIDQAIASYEEAIKYGPGQVSPYYDLAMLHLGQGDTDGALGYFEKVTELAPRDASALNNSGVLLYKQGRVVEAEERLRMAIEVDAQYMEAWYSLGRILLAEDNVAEAADAFQACLEIKPTYEKAREYWDICRTSLHAIPIPRLRIGFVTLWYERGQAYVTRMLRDALTQEHETFILARNGGTQQSPRLATTGEWAVPNLTTFDQYRIPQDVLRRWVIENRLDVVLFNEEYDFGLVDAARKCGAKTIGYYVWELFNPQWSRAVRSLYDAVICPTRSSHRRFRNLGIDNAVYVQWGVESELFHPLEREKGGAVRFFHPAGWGGLHGRRGTPYVIEAFRKADLPDAELLIHTQQGEGREQDGNIALLYGTLPRRDLVRLYQESDVAVLPSKWEGLGLTFLEAIGCGLPIITVDAPPMNEFVRNGETGLLCRIAERRRYPGIFVEGMHVDTDDMAEKMRRLAGDSALRQQMEMRIRSIAAVLWDQESFRLGLVKMLRQAAIDAGEGTRGSSIHVSGAPGSEVPLGRPYAGLKHRLRLVSKNYTGCELVRKEDGRQFIRKDDHEEPLVIHLVSARWSNHPWGMGNEVYRALERFGATIIDTDFRRDLRRLPKLLDQQAHLLLVLKGNGVPPELVRRSPCKTILWYQDDVFATDHASKHIAYNGWAFDTVYSFDGMALERYRELGVTDPRWLPLAMSPEVHRRMFLVERAHEICFVGNVYPNRKALLERLTKRFDLLVTKAFMDDMVRIFNASSIVLNLGVGPTGIQQRVFEALGCGSFLLTNEVPERSRLFKDRVHLVYFSDDTVEELAAYYLSHDEEREGIALAGYREVCAKHTFAHRILQILDDAGMARPVLPPSACCA